VKVRSNQSKLHDMTNALQDTKGSSVCGHEIALTAGRKADLEEYCIIK